MNRSIFYAIKKQYKFFNVLDRRMFNIFTVHKIV